MGPAGWSIIFNMGSLKALAKQQSSLSSNAVAFYLFIYEALPCCVLPRALSCCMLFFALFFVSPWALSFTYSHHCFPSATCCHYYDYYASLVPCSIPCRGAACLGHFCLVLPILCRALLLYYTLQYVVTSCAWSCVIKLHSTHKYGESYICHNFMFVISV